MAAAVYHVRFTCAADYNARRLPYRPAHLAQLTALRDDGRVVAGGPEPDGGAAHIFYRVADRAALDALIAANEFQRAGLFVAHAARVFDDFVEPSERLPHDAGWSVTLVEGVPADRARARAALTRLSTDKLVNLGGFFADGRALAVVREPDAAAAVARLVTAGGWDAASPHGAPLEPDALVLGRGPVDVIEWEANDRTAGHRNRSRAARAIDRRAGSHRRHAARRPHAAGAHRR